MLSSVAPTGEKNKKKPVSIDGHSDGDAQRGNKRKDCRYDKDTSHARDGAFQFPLPVKDISRLSDSLLVQRVGACRGDLKKRIEYEDLDDEYETAKKRSNKARAGITRLQSPTTKIEELAIGISALKTFYNLFRNLENLDGDQKIEFLDRILDFHIQCNIGLIDFVHSLAQDDTDFQTFSAYIVTISGQVFLSSNIGNQSLVETLEVAIARCSNDFKKLLLVSLYGDLRLPSYQRKLEEFVDCSESMAAVEIIYLQIRYLMVTYEGVQVPSSLVSAFLAAFRKRHKLNGGKATIGAFDKSYTDALEKTKKEHLNFLHTKEILSRTKTLRA